MQGDMRVVDTAVSRRPGRDGSLFWPLVAFAATTTAFAVIKHRIHRRQLAEAAEKNVPEQERKEEREEDKRFFDIIIPMPRNIVSKTKSALDLLPGLFPHVHKEDDHSKAETEETEPTESSDLESAEFDLMEPFRVQRITI